jgi:hypothetical protein
VRGINVAKWIGKWLLQIPVYVVTAYVMRLLIGTCYRLLTRLGGNLPPKFLLEHILLLGLICGFLAGLVGLLVFKAMLLLPLDIEPGPDSPWKRPQAWTWIFSTCWLAIGIISWPQTFAHHSVLSTSSGMAGPVVSASDIIAAFFTQGCSVKTGILTNCMTQIRYSYPWLGTLGYSAAPFVQSGWWKRLRGFQDPDKPPLEQDHVAQITK